MYTDTSTTPYNNHRQINDRENCSLKTEGYNKTKTIKTIIAPIIKLYITNLNAKLEIYNNKITIIIVIINPIIIIVKLVV